MTLASGLIIAIPTVIIAGPIFGSLVAGSSLAMRMHRRIRTGATASSQAARRGQTDAAPACLLDDVLRRCCSQSC